MYDQANPLGIMDVDHLEVTFDPRHKDLRPLFSLMGFKKTASNPASKVEIYSQGRIHFHLDGNEDPASPARQYYLQHGEGVCTLSFHVPDVEKTLAEALKRGATLKQDLHTYSTEEGEWKVAAIAGLGDILNKFIQRPAGNCPLPAGFVATIQDQLYQPLQHPLIRIDHFTNNVPKGQMEEWVEFYKNIYGFVETRYFDIKGLKTGLVSKVMQMQDGRVIIPINEPEIKNGKSQIQEFLDLHKGSGVQHIALTTNNILSTVCELRDRQMRFLKVPPTYYQDLSQRPFLVEEDVQELQQRQLLVDGDREGYLLQIFSENYIGPSFFEIIQRKKHLGFGEGNFKALFEAIERDQMERGYL